MCHLYCTRPFKSAFQKLITIFPSTQCIRFYSFFIWVTEDIRTISDLFKATHEVSFSNRHRISGLLFPFLCCSLHHSVAKRPFNSVVLRTQQETDSPAGLRHRREREFVLFFFFFFFPSCTKILSKLRFLIPMDSNQSCFAIYSLRLSDRLLYISI